MNNKNLKCWDCKKEVEPNSIFCPACKKIQPSAPIDHFTRLGITKNFEIGTKNLEVAYFALQRQLHPDLFVNKSEKEKNFSMQQTMDINAAYETLRLPLNRAQYILFLEGIIVNQDNKTSTKPSQELLIESLQTRESLANAQTQEEVRNISVKTAEDKLTCIDNIKNDLLAKNFTQAAQNTIRLKYLEKLIEEIRLKNP